MRVTKPYQCRHLVSDEQGKGALGCVVSLVMLGLAGYIIFSSGPEYYAFKGFETDVKTAVSRAGANFSDDEVLIADILNLAKRNEVKIAREDIKIERFAGQIFLTIRHTIPLDLLVIQHEMNFEIKASSYIGKL
jgi:hypothetical protein